MEERWAPVSINERYEVSTLGRVRNVVIDRIMRLRQMHHGYLSVAMWHPEVSKTRVHIVHRLVAMAFIPNPEALAEVNHKDFDRTNNRIENLEWASKRTNVDHALAAGNYDPVKSPKRLKKLALADVDTIRCLQGKQAASLIADRFSVTPDTIYNIWRGKTFSSSSSVKWARTCNPNRGRGAAKLTANQVLALRSMAKAGASVPECAKAFAINIETVRAIIKRQTWAWLDQPQEQDTPHA